MRDPTPSAVFSSRFQLSSPFIKLVGRGINLEAKDVLYNYTNATSMTRSQTGWAFKTVKEFHVITLQTFIDVFSPPKFAVMDLNYGTANYIPPSLIVLNSKFILQSDIFPI
jgi:hypothetical protein